MSEFELLAEHDVRAVKLGDAERVDKSAMFESLKSVLRRFHQHAGTGASEGGDQSRIGFLFPDLMLFLNCGCRQDDCDAKDGLWTCEIKAYREKASYDELVRRAVVTAGLRVAWAQLEAELGTLRGGFDAAMKVRVHTNDTQADGQDAFRGNSGIKKLSEPRLLRALRNTGAQPSPPLAEDSGAEGIATRESENLGDVDWAACLPRGRVLKTIGNLMRKMSADLQTRVGVAQSLAYGLSLAEASSAQNHAALIGVRFTTAVVDSCTRVTLELKGWPGAPRAVGIRELLGGLSHDHLPHSLLDEGGSFDPAAMRVYHSHLRGAIHAQAGREKRKRLAKSVRDPVPPQSAEAAAGSSTHAFEVGADDRLSVVSTAHPKLSGAAQDLLSSRGAASCAPMVGGAQQRRGGGAGGSGSSAGSRGCSSHCAGSGRAKKSSSSSSARGTSTTSTGTSNSLSGFPQRTPRSTNLDIGLQLSGIDIAEQLQAEDLGLENDANRSLPLGAEAESFSAAGGLDLGRLGASLRRAEEDGARAVKCWSQDPEHAELVLAIVAAALEDTGCEVHVVPPEEMDEIRSRQQLAELLCHRGVASD